MNSSHLTVDCKICFAMSAMGLVSAGVFLRYVEALPFTPTPFDALKELIFRDTPSAQPAVGPPPTFDFSEINFVIAWAALTALAAGIALFKSLAIKATSENAQLRAATVVCSLLAGLCLLMSAPMFASAYRVMHGRF